MSYFFCNFVAPKGRKYGGGAPYQRPMVKIRSTRLTPSVVSLPSIRSGFSIDLMIKQIRELVKLFVQPEFTENLCYGVIGELSIKHRLWTTLNHGGLRRTESLLTPSTSSETR